MPDKKKAYEPDGRDQGFAEVVAKLKKNIRAVEAEAAEYKANRLAAEAAEAEE